MNHNARSMARPRSRRLGRLGRGCPAHHSNRTVHWSVRNAGMSTVHPRHHLVQFRSRLSFRLLVEFAELHDQAGHVGEVGRARFAGCPASVFAGIHDLGAQAGALFVGLVLSHFSGWLSSEIEQEDGADAQGVSVSGDGRADSRGTSPAFGETNHEEATQNSLVGDCRGRNDYHRCCRYGSPTDYEWLSRYKDHCQWSFRHAIPIALSGHS